MVKVPFVNKMGGDIWIRLHCVSRLCGLCCWQCSLCVSLFLLNCTNSNRYFCCARSIFYFGISIFYFGITLKKWTTPIFYLRSIFFSAVHPGSTSIFYFSYRYFIVDHIGPQSKQDSGQRYQNRHASIRAIPQRKPPLLFQNRGKQGGLSYRVPLSYVE